MRYLNIPNIGDAENAVILSSQHYMVEPENTAGPSSTMCAAENEMTMMVDRTGDTNW